MVIPTSSQPLCTACCSALPEPYSSPATANVRSAAAWKSESACSRVVSVTYQMRPAFSQANPPIFVAVRKRMIWNARIDVDTAVVVSRVQIIRHVGRLRILPELRIVVSRTGIFHGTQRDATYAWHEQPGADQPIGLIGRLTLKPAVYCVTPCVSSCPTTSMHFVKRS